MDRSISEYFYEPGGVEGHRCGYCGSKDTNISHGMWTHYLTCEDYQDLIDRGWRRSGKYCYKPVMDRTCCPMYAIRCDVTKFRLSKSQKVVLKRVNEYLLHGRQRIPGREGTKNRAEGGPSETRDKVRPDDVAGATAGALAKKSKTVRPGVGPDPTKPACRKAKVIRREQKELKLAQKALSAVDVPSSSASSTSAPAEPTHPEMATALPTVPFFEVGPDGKKPLEMFLPLPATDKPPAHRLEIKLIQSSPPSREFQSTFKESYALYKKYQTRIHHDDAEDCKEKQYRRFLCDSPLIPTKGPENWPCGYGSYHQHYYVNGKLVMVGVVDILPSCLSSVYVYYDPDFSFLTPGVYSALRELELTRKLYLHHHAFTYYCMGYYVHDCQKMRYKGQYYPSYILCPESYCYVPIESCRPKLDASRYSRLNEERTEVEDVEVWLEKALVLFQGMAMPYGVFKTIAGSSHDAKVREYARFVGPRVASRMLLYLNE